MSFESACQARLTELFQFLDDINLWKNILNQDIDLTILSSAQMEFEYGFQAAVSGQYRFAFLSQRYFLEQLCRFIYFSTNELHLRQWKLGLRDVPWAVFIDKENGIFSKTFIKAFYPGVEKEGCLMRRKVELNYRESSEFIHGNFKIIEEIPSKIEFVPSLLQKWLQLIDDNRTFALFLLFMRFGKDLSESNILKLEEMAKDEICSIEKFNLLFSR